MVHVLRKENVIVDKLISFIGYNHLDFIVFNDMPLCVVLNVLANRLGIIYPRKKGVD